MAFPAITWANGQTVTASNLNDQIRDNLTTLRAGGVAIASQAANDFVYATSSSQLGRLAAVEGYVPQFTGGAWTMSAISSGGDNASSVIAAGSFA